MVLPSRLHEKNQAIPQIDHRYCNQNTQKDRSSTKLSKSKQLLRGNRCCAILRVVLTDGQREGGFVESERIVVGKNEFEVRDERRYCLTVRRKFSFLGTVSPHVTGDLALNALAAEAKQVFNAGAAIDAWNKFVADLIYGAIT